jgi:hypothetical protein
MIVRKKSAKNIIPNISEVGVWDCLTDFIAIDTIDNSYCRNDCVLKARNTLERGRHPAEVKDFIE